MNSGSISMRARTQKCDSFVILSATKRLILCIKSDPHLHMTKKILIIEDQVDLGALIALNLESLGFQVKHVTHGDEGWSYAASGNYDLIVLDIMLPGLDGLEICKGLRSMSNFTPILMLTAKKTELDRVLGLETGADDYLTKPFSVIELQARVKALLRRVDQLANHEHGNSSQENSAHETLVYGNLSINKSRREVKIANKAVQLTVKEFDLLLYLAVYPGKVFTREQLLNAVWGYQHNGYEHTVNSHINRLRAKIETDPNRPGYVHTVWGVGYKFNDE